MSWKFEKIFGAKPSTAPKEVIQEGRFIWVTGENKVYVYEFVGESSGHEGYFDKYDELNYNHLDGKLKLVSEIAVPEGSAWICSGYSYMYVANAYQFNKITRIHKVTKQVVSVVTCPETMNSNLILDNGKLWMVSTAPESQDPAHDRQKLYIMNGVNLSFASVEIPVRKQLARAYLTPGWNGHIYVTNFNNVSVSKFNNITGAYEGQIRTNAFPQAITVTPDRDIFVSSYAGMLTRIDGLTEEVFNAYSTEETALSLSSQGSNLVWYCSSSNVVGKVNRSDNSLVFTKTSDGDDWHINVEDLVDKQFTRILVTTPFQYQQFDGTQWDTIDVKPYLIMLGAEVVMAVRLDNYLMRENYVQISGQAMISTGSEDYMGEVG